MTNTLSDDTFLSDPDEGSADDADLMAGADAVIDPSGGSDLDTLRADLAAEVVEEIVLLVPGRPGYETVHTADIPAQMMDQLRKRAKTRGGLNGIKLSALLLAQTNTGIRKGGRRLTDEDGQPLVIRSGSFLEIQGASTAAEAARKFYGRDGDLDAASRALLTAAGWGAETEGIMVGDEDTPTRRRG